MDHDKDKIIEFPFEKISDVRDLQNFLKLTREDCVIHLNNVNLATTEAQNAFLKHLEEPQKNVKYLITVKSTFGILPTILSRCEIINISKDKRIVSKEVADFPEKSVTEKLAYTANIKKRQDAVNFCEDLIYLLRNKMLTGKKKQENANSILAVQRALTNIKNNGNIMLQLANLAIKL